MNWDRESAIMRRLNGRVPRYLEELHQSRDGARVDGELDGGIVLDAQEFADLHGRLEV